MKASHYIKRVKESKEFKEFIKQDPKAYLCSLFFIRDFTEKKNETQVDFYSPKKKTIFSFKVNGKVEKAPNKKAKTIENKKFIPKPLMENTKLDIDEMKDTLADEMHNREMAYEIEKVLVFLNIVDGKPVWNCTGFLRGLGLLQTHVDDETNTVLFMEKKSLFDMIKFTGNKIGAQTGSINPIISGQPEIKAPDIKAPKIKIQIDKSDMEKQEEVKTGKTKKK
ncbi:MAG: hypothetical protein AABX50_02190 [Nanoarchaeota archaeon]